MSVHKDLDIIQLSLFFDLDSELLSQNIVHDSFDFSRPHHHLIPLSLRTPEDTIEIIIPEKDIIFDIDPKYFRKTEVDRLQCNVNETYKKLKWKPKVFHKKLIKKMIDEEILLRDL